MKLNTLSNSDKDILQNIYEELEKINIPTTYSSKEPKKGFQTQRTGNWKIKGARSCVFGSICHFGKVKDSRLTLKYPHILPLLSSFIANHLPDFKFTKVYVNRNTICDKHIDSGNCGESLIIGLGDYRGGETTLFLEDKALNFDISKKSLIFDGSKIPHKSQPFSGIRYSLVYFK